MHCGEEGGGGDGGGGGGTTTPVVPDIVAGAVGIGAPLSGWVYLKEVHPGNAGIASWMK